MGDNVQGLDIIECQQKIPKTGKSKNSNLSMSLRNGGQNQRNQSGYFRGTASTEQPRLVQERCELIHFVICLGIN